MKPTGFLIILFLAALLTPVITYSQDDDGEEIKMSQEEWHLKRDQYAVSAIKSLERIEKLDSLIDSLKRVYTESEKTIINCDDDLYALVGATKEQVADFKKKFEETEGNINDKKGVPSDYVGPMNEISNSKIRCLPEFNDRYYYLKNKLEQLFADNKVNEVKKESVEMKDTYTVIKGDYLAKISEKQYGNKMYWPAIWEANKEDIIKENFLTDDYDKIYFNPNFIYPGQVLKIPVLTNEQIDLIKKNRKHKK